MSEVQTAGGGKVRAEMGRKCCEGKDTLDCLNLDGGLYVTAGQRLGRSQAGLCTCCSERIKCFHCGLAGHSYTVCLFNLAPAPFHCHN